MISFAEFKKFFIWTSIGSLVVAALVAVATVLMGQFNEITARVFLTLFMVVVHSLVSLAFIWDDSQRDTFNKLAFFINTVFVLIVLSFITSIFGVWKIISSDNIWHFYQTFFLIGFAALHANILSKASKKEKYIDAVINANYIFIISVVCIFIPIIFTTDALNVLGEMYFRFLAALGIIDGTLSILTIIFYKLYMHKHPEIKVSDYQDGITIWVWILVIYLLFQVVGPFIWLSGGLFWR